MSCRQAQTEQPSIVQPGAPLEALSTQPSWRGQVLTHISAREGEGRRAGRLR
eukprot:CAMPEP_0119361138 /NCGR_PEP_ID=MMETSP1334-20130426/8532_1 /TAXON_ID=127549 /ORGANISM="Calcidiscus leptoporus, Strain RCC1130" /LENGTH=51 /DNA_ID=CAMNT_0007376083 /DNA_START=57 /DNA_END=209 /DNA_ORIENTATION=+